MSAPKLNAEEAYATLDDIDADPASWDQDSWFARHECGTTACFAGRLLLRHGYRPYFREDYPGEPRTYTDYAISPTGNTVRVRDAAMELLGLPVWADDTLFDGANTREDLHRMVAEIFGPRPERVS